jgi:hypothetical protein
LPSVLNRISTFPLHQQFDEVEEAHTGRILYQRIRTLAQLTARCDEFRRRVRVVGIVYQRGEDHRAAGGERSSCPPEVQRAGVAVPDRFFARAGDVDRFERQRDFDQFFALGHI